MKIGVVGGGVVGSATARCYLEHFDEVRVWDILKERRTHLYAEVLECDLLFVCLPEEHLDSYFSELIGPKIKSWRDKNFVIKSTVPIGTTRRLQEKYHLTNLVHSPEFLTARCAHTDAQIPARNIIGDTAGPGRYFNVKNHCCVFLTNLYEVRFPGVPVIHMTSDESEMVKLVVNSFFAVKVAFFNEARTLADKLNLAWDTVIRGVLSDGRIAHSHTKVPGPDGKFGFGGACLPKDLEMLAIQLNQNCLPASVMGGAIFRNTEDRKRGDS